MNDQRQQSETTRVQRSAMKSLSIGMVTGNCKKFMQECLDSLEACRRNPQAEIVVDNASWDGTPELVRDSYPEVTPIRNDENLGFAKGHNAGIRRSTGRYIFLIHADVHVLDGPGSLRALHAHGALAVLSELGVAGNLS